MHPSLSEALLLDTLEQGFSCLDMGKPDVYQFTALAMHDFGGSFARFQILISRRAGGGFSCHGYKLSLNL